MRYSISSRTAAATLTLLLLCSGIQSQSSCSGLTMEVYNSYEDCQDFNISPTTTGIVYGDGQCRTVETTSIGALYDQLPGTYRATCDAATNSITFTDSSCATGTCSTLGTDKPGVCKRIGTVPSFVYSASTRRDQPDQPAAYPVTAPTGRRICAYANWNSSSGLQLNIFFAIRGTCDCVVAPPPTTNAPVAPRTSFPVLSAPVSSLPTSSPVESPTTSSPVSKAPTLAPVVAPTWPPFGQKVPMVTATTEPPTAAETSTITTMEPQQSSTQAPSSLRPTNARITEASIVAAQANDPTSAQAMTTSSNLVSPLNEDKSESAFPVGIISGVVAAGILAMAVIGLLVFRRRTSEEQKAATASKEAAVEGPSKYSTIDDDTWKEPQIMVDPALCDDISTLEGGTVYDNMTLNVRDDPTATVDLNHYDGDYNTSGGGTALTKLSKLGFDAGSVDDHCSFDGQYDLYAKDIFNNVRTEIKVQPFSVEAPAGMLGMVVDSINGVPSVRAIKDSSPLRDKVRIGDLVVAVNQLDVTGMSATEVSNVISSQQNRKRTLVLARPEQ